MATLNWFVKNQNVLPIGLDIGHSAVKMVQLAACDGGVRILAADRAPVDWSMASDEDARRELVTQTVQQLLARNRFKGREVISSLPPDKLRITSLRVAETEMYQADKNLRREAAHRFGLDPRVDPINYVLAGNVRQGDELKSEFIVFATDDETIRSHIRLLEGAGLQPRGIDVGPCALFRNFERTLRRQEDRERTVLFVDVGHHYTIVVFGRAGEMCFVKQMAFGTSRFAEDIAAKLDITPAEAETIRRKMRNGDTVDASTRRTVVDTLHATAERLAAEISLCLRYYTVTFRGKRVERAVLAGGGVHETTLLDVMKHRLAIDTAVAEPFRGIDVAHGDEQTERHGLSADFALAVGLSLKGINPCAAEMAGVDAELEPQPESVSS